MATNSLQILLAENKEASRILAELGALLGSADPCEDSETPNKEGHNADLRNQNRP